MSGALERSEGQTCWSIRVRGGAHRRKIVVNSSERGSYEMIKARKTGRRSGDRSARNEAQKSSSVQKRRSSSSAEIRSSRAGS